MTTDEKDYIDYLNSLCDAPDYGLLLFQADPIMFEIGKNEWLRDNGRFN